MRQLLFPLFFLLCLSVQGQQSTSINKQIFAIKTIDIQAIPLVVDKPIVMKDNTQTRKSYSIRNSFVCTTPPLPESAFHTISGKDFRRIASGRN